MKEKHLATLEKIGLSSAEAQIYLALTRAGAPMTASAIVAATGVPRGSIYPTLSSLTDKGLVEAEPGYGGRFSAVPAERAMPFLIAREKEELIERENLAGVLANELKSERDPSEIGLESEVIQVLRDPRVIAERFERLQLEAKHQIDAIVKAPIFGARPENPGQEEARRRGVRFRGLYERAAIEQPDIKPYVASWIAGGEEVRVWDGELPHKVAIFDKQALLLPLIAPGVQTKVLLVRHPQLATSLTVMFEFYWNQAKPIAATPKGFASERRDKGSTKAVKSDRSRSARSKADKTPRRTTQNGSSESSRTITPTQNKHKT